LRRERRAVGRGCYHRFIFDVSNLFDDARLPASKRGASGLFDQFEGNSRGCVIETALKGAVHHAVGKVNVHVKRAVIAGLCSRLPAFEFSKGANFKPVASDCLERRRIAAGFGRSPRECRNNRTDRGA
jgi:hypothetical protein